MAEKWVPAARDINSPMCRNYIWTGSLLLWKDLFKIPNPKWGIISRNNDIDYIGLLSTWKKAGDIFFSRVKKDPEVFEKAINQSLDFGEFMNKETEKIFLADLKACTASQLIEHYENFAALQAKEYAYGLLLPLVDMGGNSFIDGNLKKILETKIKDRKQAEEAYSVFTYPWKDSFAEEQEKKLLLIAKIIHDNKELSAALADSPENCLSLMRRKHQEILEKLEKHAEEWAWIYYVFAGKSCSENDFLGFIREYLQKGIDPSKELDARVKRRRDIEKSRAEWEKKLKLTPYEAWFAGLASKIVWAKPRRKDYQSRTYYHVEGLLREIGKRIGLSLDEVRSTPPDMLKKALLKNENPDRKKIAGIKKLHVCVPVNGKITLYSGKKAQDFIKKNVLYEEESNAAYADEIKGSCACMGKIVRGAAKIINKTEDMAKMKDGDILVSMATTPSVVPAMKKAAAIVTDEGGLTCHAAIVSRELNIPCVVGTKFISRAVKDGEILEVDANNGIIRKIRKETI